MEKNRGILEGRREAPVPASLHGQTLPTLGGSIDSRLYSAVTSSPLRAIVLAAGRGERMRPLTDHTPKPLLPILGRPMIEWHLLALARDGVREVVVNTAWLEDQFEPLLGDGSRFGLSLSYSHEGRDFGGALETAGGIATVLDWLSHGGTQPFWVVSGDIWAPDFRFDAELAARFAGHEAWAHLWMVPNPAFHTKGDFADGAPCPELGEGVHYGAVAPSAEGAPTRTYANLALMKAELLSGARAGERSALGPLLYRAMDQGRITLQSYDGRWENVGTPAQWQALQSPAPEAGA